MSLSVTLGRRGGFPDDDYAAGVGRNAIYAPSEATSGARLPEGETPALFDLSGHIVRNVTPYGEANRSLGGALVEGTGGLILALAGGAAAGLGSGAAASESGGAAATTSGGGMWDSFSNWVSDLFSGGADSVVTGETSTGLATVGGETGAENIVAETGLLDPETGLAITNAPANSGITLNDVNRAIDVANKIVGTTAAVQAVKNNVAGARGQRSDAAPLAGTWGAPGTPQYRNAQGTYAYQPAAAQSASAFLPWILAAFAGFLFVLLIARR